MMKIARCFTGKEDAVIEIVNRLGDSDMRDNSHGIEKYRGMKIKEAAKLQLSENNTEKNAAIALIGVVLGANRNWNKVVRPVLERLKQERPRLSFLELRKLMSEMNWTEFKTFWGHKDQKKYNVLSRLLDQILDYANEYPTLTDFQLANKWVREFDIDMLQSKHGRYHEFTGCIPNIGVATFQHLRLTFGVDTVKPDQRVKEVLLVEFDRKLSDLDAIRAVEEIAQITKNKVGMIDQIFVKYGSGYYNRQGARSSRNTLGEGSKSAPNL